MLILYRITKVYEFETYDYPVQIQESISELSTSIGYNISSFAATNLKGTNLPVPNPPTSPPESHHKTLPHALVRAANTAAAATSSPQVPGESASRLSKALGLYGAGWEKIASARLDQDAGIQENFLHPWQTTLNTSLAVAMKARQAVRTSRLELDAAKQTWVLLVFQMTLPVNIFLDRLKNSNPAKQEQARFEVENAEDDLVQKTEVAITLMKTVLENVCSSPSPVCSWCLTFFVA